jgi:competence protein ComEA
MPRVTEIFINGKEQQARDERRATYNVYSPAQNIGHEVRMSKQLFSGLALSLSLLLTSAAGADDKAKPAPTKAPEKAPAKAPEKTPAKTDDKAPAKTDDKAAKPAPKAAELDLNTATEKELAALPGVGDATAKKIVAGRPYTKKDQLVAKKILTQAAYDKLKDAVVAKQADATPKTDAVKPGDGSVKPGDGSVKPGDGSVKPTVPAKTDKAPAATPAKTDKPATAPATPAKTEKAPASTPATPAVKK